MNLRSACRRHGESSSCGVRIDGSEPTRQPRRARAPRARSMETEPSGCAASTRSAGTSRDTSKPETRSAPTSLLIGGQGSGRPGAIEFHAARQRLVRGRLNQPSANALSRPERPVPTRPTRLPFEPIPARRPRAGSGERISRGPSTWLSHMTPCAGTVVGPAKSPAVDSAAATIPEPQTGRPMSLRHGCA